MDIVDLEVNSNTYQKKEFIRSAIKETEDPGSVKICKGSRRLSSLGSILEAKLLRQGQRMGLVILHLVILLLYPVIFRTLWATHGGKGANFWIDGKRRILIVTFPNRILAKSRKKHERVVI